MYKNQIINIDVSDFETRRKFIGASEAHRCINDQMNLWIEKTGDSIPDDISHLPQIKRGIRYEKHMPQWVYEDFGMEILPNTKTYKSKHKKFPIATPDGFFKDKKDVYGIEFKAPSIYNVNYGEQDTDDIPLANLMQCHHTMAVLPQLKGYFLFAYTEDGGKRYIIKKDNNISKALIEKEERFMSLVEHKIKPPPQNEKDLLHHFPNSNKIYIPNPSISLLNNGNQLQKIRAVSKENKGIDKDLSYKIKKEIGENAGYIRPDGKKVHLQRIEGKKTLVAEIAKEKFPKEYAECLVNQFSPELFKEKHSHLVNDCSISQPYTKLQFPRD